MFSFNFYRIQEFFTTDGMDVWYEKLLFELIVPAGLTFLAAYIAYRLGAKQAREAFARDKKSEKEKQENANQVFLEYCIELIRESHKCGKLTLENISKFLQELKLEKGNAALNEVAMANAIRFSSSDLARLHSLFKEGEISSNFLKSTPSTEEIFKLVNSIDALPSMQQRAIVHSKEYFINLKEPNLSLYQCHDQTVKLVGNEEMGRLLGPIAQEKVNREPIQVLNEIIRPIVQKVEAMSPRNDKQRQILECGRIAEEAGRSILEQRRTYLQKAEGQQRIIKKSVDEIAHFIEEYLIIDGTEAR